MHDTMWDGKVQCFLMENQRECGEFWKNEALM